MDLKRSEKLDVSLFVPQTLQYKYMVYRGGLAGQSKLFFVTEPHVTGHTQRKKGTSGGYGYRDRGFNGIIKMRNKDKGGGCVLKYMR